MLKSLIIKAFRIATLLKSVSNTNVFQWNLQNFKNSYFEENLQTIASKTCSNFAFFKKLILMAEIGTYALVLVS